MMLRIAICDDDKTFQMLLQSKIEAYMAKNTIPSKIFLFSSGSELLKTNPVQFDIAFLDVQMKNGGGIETGEQMKQCRIDTVIIFVSGYIEFAPYCYRLNAIRYVLKSRLDRDLEDSIKAALEQVQLKNETIAADEQSFLISDIHYIESTVGGLKIYTKFAGLPYVCKNNNTEIVKRLETRGFLRCNQNILVNSHFVKSINDLSIIMWDNTKILLSKSHKEEVRRKYLRSLV